MSESAEQPSHHLETSGSPSGGSGGDAVEHLPGRNRAAPESAGRGRQREQRQRRWAGSCPDINTQKLRQMRGGHREVCPSSAAGHKPPRGGEPGGQQRVSAGNNGQEKRPHEALKPGKDVDSDTGLDARLGRKRHRRGSSKKKRHWKPYDKLSWEEKKALEERETARASRIREEMFAKGLPVAPYNTTQFLMDEHDREEPDLNTETPRRSLGLGGRLEDTGSEEDFFEHEEDDDDGGSGGGGGSDGIGRPGNAGGEFLQRDFSETYAMYHVETLQNMTKQELVQEYLELEKCMSRLEEENNRLRRAVEPAGPSVEGPLLRLREMERELERLRAQNTELLRSQERPQVVSN